MSKLNVLEALRRTVRHVFNHVAEVDATSRKWVEEQISGIELTPGDSPYIKDGNWWIGNTDTGVKAQGESPVKGEDYFTEEDIETVVQSVLNALPNGDEVSY